MFQPLLNQLQSPDPNQRKQAAHTLGAIRHPRAKEALRFVYRHDPDPGVREAALRYLPGIRAKLGLPPIATSTVPTPNAVVWDCVYCGTRDIKGAACPNCGASRPTSADDQHEAQSPDALATLFQSAPAQRWPVNPNQPTPGLPMTRWQARQVIRQQRQIQRASSNLIALVFLLLFCVVLATMWLAMRGHFIFLR